jgi:hypothetical protein
MSKVLLGIVIGVFALYAYQRIHQPAAEASAETKLQFVEQSERQRWSERPVVRTRDATAARIVLK